MATISTYTVQIWEGLIREPVRSKQLHRRQGVNGTGLIVGTFNSNPSPVLTLSTVADKAAALELINNFRKLDCTVIAVVDDQGITHNDITVMQVLTRYWSAPVMAGAAETTDTYIVEARWLFLPAFMEEPQDPEN